ncbi:MAG TPA: hypothetical protein VKS79_02020 [Gemmataceae bacterium]|nr:hypothetical protein [Gemmataceae bacterium]
MQLAEWVPTEVITVRVSRHADRRAHFEPPKDTIRFGEVKEWEADEIELVGRRRRVPSTARNEAG